MRRGEVWWADLPTPIGRRPVLILSRDSMPVARQEITVAYLTTIFRHTAVEVPLTTADGVPRPCVVNLDSINHSESVSSPINLRPFGGPDGGNKDGRP